MNLSEQQFHPLNLDAKTKKQLRDMVFGQKTEHRLQVRSSIIWYLAKDLNVDAVSRIMSTTTVTVRKWRDRFIANGIPGLNDLPRSGAPSKFTAEQRCEVIAIACDKPSCYSFEGDERWTCNMLTTAVNQTLDFSMSRSSIARTLHNNDLRPHKMQMWLHSKDPQFKEKVNCIVSLYLDPPRDTVVLSIDEKTGMQANERKYATQLPIPGRTGRYEHEYIRHGTQSLIAGFNTQTGKVTASCGATRTADDLMQFMEKVAVEYADAKHIIIIWDNLNTHCDGKNKRWTEFNQRHGGKFNFVYTPIHASWLNQVEIFFSILHKRCLKHGNFASTQDLNQRVMSFIKRWNEREGHAFNWTFGGYPMQSKAVA